MAAKKGNKNAKGNKGGKPYSKKNRDKAATLKGLSLDWMIKIMKGKNEDLKKEVSLRIASSCIPQEVKHSGNENDDTPITFSAAIKYIIPTKPEKKDSE